MNEEQKRPCGAHGARLVSLEKEKEEIWQAIDKLRDSVDKLRNRLPNWAVLMIAGLSGALGWALQWGFTMARIAAASK